MGTKFQKFKDIFQFNFLTQTQAQQIAEEAARKAALEERAWHEDKDDSSPMITADDNFHLYHNESGQAELTGKYRKAYEKWISGGTAGQGGGGRIDLSEDLSVDYLNLMQRVVKSKYYSDPHARSIIDNWTFYTIGGGVKVLLPNEDLTKFINDFRVENKMVRREKYFTRALYQDGELFIACYIDKTTGKVQLRRIRPHEIVEIETHPEDIENIFSFHWQYTYSPSGSTQTIDKDVWVPSVNYHEWKKSKGPFSARKSKHEAKLKKNPEVLFIKLGDDTELRGRVPLQPVLKLLKAYQDWLDDRIRLNHERAKVVWIKEIKGRSAEVKERRRAAPRGGIMLVENENVKYRIENPQLASDQAKEDGLQILYTIGAGTSLPIHILNQRSSESVYASIRKSDTPFSQFIRSHQEIIGEEFELLYRKVIKEAVKTGELPEKVKIPHFAEESLTQAFETINKLFVKGTAREIILKEANEILSDGREIREVETSKIPISIDFPEIIRENMKDQAGVLKIHHELGIASRATLSAKAGYDWKEELALMKAEMNDGFIIPETKGDEDPDEDPKDDPKDKEDGK